MTFYDKYMKYKNKYLEAQKEYNKLTTNCNSCNNKLCNCNKQSGGAKPNELFLFKANWCGHCKNFMSTWDKINNEFKNKITIKTFDADTKIDQKHFDKYQIQGFPTLIFNNMEYNGSRDFNSIKDFINQNIN